MQRAVLSVLAGTALLVLVGCGKPVATSTVTLGPQSQTGVLVSTGISLLRRGSHVLKIDGRTLFYVESTSTNLQAFANQTVAVHGTVKKNTSDEYLPVMVVDSITAVKGQGVHEWNVPSLGIIVTVPEQWVASLENGMATFTAGADKVPVLAVSFSSGSVLPVGDPTHISGKPAVRITQLNGDEEVWVMNNKRVLRFRFSTGSHSAEESLMLHEQYLSALALLRFMDSSSSSSSSGSTIGGQVCGGEAGLLCSVGQYCDIDDASTGMGHCKSL